MCWPLPISARGSETRAPETSTEPGSHPRRPGPRPRRAPVCAGRLATTASGAGAWSRCPGPGRQGRRAGPLPERQSGPCRPCRSRCSPAAGGAKPARLSTARSRPLDRASTQPAQPPAPGSSPANRGGARPGPTEGAHSLRTGPALRAGRCSPVGLAPRRRNPPFAPFHWLEADGAEPLTFLGMRPLNVKLWPRLSASDYLGGVAGRPNFGVRFRTWNPR